MKRTIHAFGFAACLTACSGTVLDTRGPDGGSPASTSTSASASGSSSENTNACPTNDDAGSSEVSATAFAPLLGTWTGYTENDPDNLVLTLRFSVVADGSAAGTITFGSGPPPAPPTDPTVGYSPNGVNAGANEGAGKPIQGFVYTALHPTFDGVRLRFGVKLHEPYKAWCELQTSYLDDPPCGFACLPKQTADMQGPPTATLINPDGGAPITADFNRYLLCSGLYVVCSCSATGCTVPLDPPDETFDMQYGALGPQRIDGSSTHFTRPVDAGQ